METLTVDLTKSIGYGKVWGFVFQGLGGWGKLDCLITESKEIMFQIGQANNSIIHTLVRNVEKLYIPREKGNEKS